MFESCLSENTFIPSLPLTGVRIESCLSSSILKASLHFLVTSNVAFERFSPILISDPSHVTFFSLWNLLGFSLYPWSLSLVWVFFFFFSLCWPMPGSFHPDEESANVFWKGHDSKYFRLCRPHSLCHNSQLCPSSKAAMGNRWTMGVAVFQQNLIHKAGSRVNLAHGPLFVKPWSRLDIRGPQFRDIFLCYLFDKILLSVFSFLPF